MFYELMKFKKVKPLVKNDWNKALNYGKICKWRKSSNKMNNCTWRELLMRENSAEIYKCHFKCSISSKRKHTIKVIQLKQKPSR